MIFSPVCLASSLIFWHPSQLSFLPVSHRFCSFFSARHISLPMFHPQVLLCEHILCPLKCLIHTVSLGEQGNESVVTCIWKETFQRCLMMLWMKQSLGFPYFKSITVQQSYEFIVRVYTDRITETQNWETYCLVACGFLWREQILKVDTINNFQLLWAKCIYI